MKWLTALAAFGVVLSGPGLPTAQAAGILTCMVTEECKVEGRFASDRYVTAVFRDRDRTTATDPELRKVAIQARAAELEADLESMERLRDVRASLLDANHILSKNVGTWTNWTAACKAIYPLQEALDTYRSVKLSPLTAARIGAVGLSESDLRGFREKLGDDCTRDWLDKSTDLAREVWNGTYAAIEIDLEAMTREKEKLQERLIELKNEAATLGTVGLLGDGAGDGREESKISDARDSKNGGRSATTPAPLGGVSAGQRAI